MRDLSRAARDVLAHWDGLDDLPQPGDADADRANYVEMKRRVEALRCAVEAAGADPEGMIPTCLEVCRSRGWSLHWTARGAYLHLEASELIEAWRGKGKSTVAQEAGDVLLVLFSILGASQTPWAAALECARAKMVDLQTRPRYPGEEYSAVHAPDDGRLPHSEGR